MQIDITCPHCAQRLSISSEHAGKTGTCNNCGNKFTVPIPQAQIDPPGVTSNSGRLAPIWIGAGIAIVAVLGAALYLGTSGRQENTETETVTAEVAPAPAAASTPPPVASASPQMPAGRVVSFPSSRVVGTWGLRSVHSTGVGGFDDQGEIAGDIFIPQGQELGVTVRPEDGAHLAFLADLAPDDLQGLSLRGVPVNDDELRHIAHLTGIRGMTIQNTRVTGEGMIHLSKLTNLEILDLSGTGIVDESFRHLRNLKKLWLLLFVETAIGDEGLKNLGGLPLLKDLHVANAKVSPAGLELFPSLERVTIYPHQLTDSMVRTLNALPNLKHVAIPRMDEAQTKSAQQKLPELEIHTW